MRLSSKKERVIVLAKLFFRCCTAHPWLCAPETENKMLSFFIGSGDDIYSICVYVWGSYVYSAYLLLACGYAKPDLWYELARNLKSRPRNQLKARPRDQQTKDQPWARLRTDRNSWLTLSSRKAWSWKDKDRQNFYPTWNCETKHLGDVMPTCTQWSKGSD